MLFFLSKGYFASGNCKKEITFTLANENPIILLHETDPDRGGVPISQIHADCDAASQGEWLDRIFVPRRPVIPFHRVKEFKIISLKMIVASLLQHQRNGNETISMEAKLKRADDEEKLKLHDDTHFLALDEKMMESASRAYLRRASSCTARLVRRTSYEDRFERLELTNSELNTLGSELFLPGEIMRETLAFPPLVLIISDENPGAPSLAQEAQKRFPDLLLTTEKTYLTTNIKPVGRDGSGDPNRFFLLYLNNETWLGAAGIKLARQAPRPRTSAARHHPMHPLLRARSPVAATL